MVGGSGLGGFLSYFWVNKVFFRSQDLRAFEKLTDLKSESCGPSEQLNLGKELQVSPSTLYSPLPLEAGPQNFPSTLGASLYPLLAPHQQGVGVDPSPAQHPPLPAEGNPRRIGMLIPAPCQRHPVWGGNNACLYPRQAPKPPVSPASSLQPPWEPPSSPLNRLLGRCPQTEGQVRN